MVDCARLGASALNPGRRVSHDQTIRDERKEKVDDGRGNTIARGLGRRRSERIRLVDASGLRRTPPFGTELEFQPRLAAQRIEMSEGAFR